MSRRTRDLAVLGSRKIRGTNRFGEPAFGKLIQGLLADEFHRIQSAGQQPRVRWRGLNPVQTTQLKIVLQRSEGLTRYHGHAIFAPLPCTFMPQTSGCKLKSSRLAWSNSAARSPTASTNRMMKRIRVREIQLH
jgi:hypothetical protein